jgi:RHS repeat-associated protein
VGGVETQYALDVAAGLPEVIVATRGGESTQYVQIGGQILAQEEAGSSGWAYTLPDHLGSVRQLAEASGQVSLAQGWDLFGVPFERSAVNGQRSPFGYTGEQWDASAELLFLRARYYDPSTGRFLTRDIWEGDPNQPLSFNAWLYGYANPIRWVDHTGLSPKVKCENMPAYLMPPAYLNLRELCEIGNGDDNDPTTLDAREKIFRTMIWGGRHAGVIDPGIMPWGAKMLEHFLDGNRAPMSIEFSMYDEFPHDPGITRATKEERPPRFPSDEPSYIRPLLHEFVYNHIKHAANSGIHFTVGPVPLNGEDYYVPSGTRGTRPRPYSRGFWAAFGHVAINGTFSADVRQNCTYDGYFAEYTANYRIDDRYEWTRGTETPFPFPLVPGIVRIPHEWELSLANASPPRAHMYSFSISWTETGHIFVRGDFSHFREVEWWEWESQYTHP